jgi:hypothetical protein
VNAAEPPRISTWLLEHVLSDRTRDALIGDLREQYHQGRSARWYRRQAWTTLLMTTVVEIWAHKIAALRTVLLASSAILLLSRLSGALYNGLFNWAMVPWRSEMLRQVWVYYGVPFALIQGLGYLLTGWTIARWHRDASGAMIILGAAVLWPWALPWGWKTAGLLRAGLWPFWDFRLALLFRAAMFFIGFPLCVVIGGLWSVRSLRARS